jgi:hypothetical protein
MATMPDLWYNTEESARQSRKKRCKSEIVSWDGYKSIINNCGHNVGAGSEVNTKKIKVLSLLGYDAMQFSESHRTIRKKNSPLSLQLKSMLIKNTQFDCLILADFSFSSHFNPEYEGDFSSEKPVEFLGLHGVTFQKIEFFIITAVRKSNPKY